MSTPPHTDLASLEADVARLRENARKRFAEGSVTPGAQAALVTAWNFHTAAHEYNEARAKLEAAKGRRRK